MSELIRVLLVDDDQDAFEIMRDVLGEIRNDHEYVLDWASSYDDGALALEKRYDVCLLDYCLGDRHGLSLVELALELGNDTPIIMLTGHSSRELERRALALGACDYLVKGDITTAMLERSIRHAIARGRTVAALRASERRYRALFDHALDSILVVDDNGRYTDANPAALALLGLTRDELLGRTIADLTGEGDSRFRALLAAGTMEGELAIRNTSGEARVVEYRAVTNVLPGQHLSVLRDISDRKQLERQLAISDRMVSIGTLAAGVAHEINNPLSSVIANLDLAREELDGDSPAQIASARDTLADARNAADRIRTIVRDLKLFSRPDEQRRDALDVCAVLESSARMAWNEIRHRAQLVRDYCAVPRVWGNDARLGQVFLNLIINAAHAIPEGNAAANQIRLVTFSDEQGTAIVEVQDTGRGIEPEHLPHLFEPFFTTKPVGVGTGLGLPICQRIVHELGGEITVASTVGRGTSFRVRLPAMPAVATSAGEQRPRTVIRPPRAGKILVVDDEPMICDAVRRILARDHDVTVVRLAKEAIDRIQLGERYDVILSDLMMPQMTGMDLHAAIAEIAPEQADAMVFLTGGAFSENASRFLDRVPNARVDKPFAPLHLRAVVRDRLT